MKKGKRNNTFCSLCWLYAPVCLAGVYNITRQWKQFHCRVMCVTGSLVKNKGETVICFFKPC